MIRARDIYDVLGLPRGLRLHLATTVAVVKLVGDAADRGLRSLAHEATLAMALHDIGNAVKLSDDRKIALRVLQEPPESLDRWRLHAAFTRARYGTDDHAATKSMLRELGIRQSLSQLIERKTSKNLPDILRRRRPVELLMLYADMRAAPQGFVSIEERHLEAQARYGRTAREGLGGTVTLSELRTLEVIVAKTFNCDASALPAAAVTALIPECMRLEMDDAFADDGHTPE